MFSEYQREMPDFSAYTQRYEIESSVGADSE